MKSIFSILLIVVFYNTGIAQKKPAGSNKIDTLFFNLYTDSLKKGTNNYINVDGKTTDGRWIPLTANELVFSASACKFEGNELVVPHDFPQPSVTVKVQLRSNPAVIKEITIWVKKLPDPENLPAKGDVLPDKKRRG